MFKFSEKAQEKLEDLLDAFGEASLQEAIDDGLAIIVNEPLVNFRKAKNTYTDLMSFDDQEDYIEFLGAQAKRGQRRKDFTVFEINKNQSLVFGDI